MKSVVDLIRSESPEKRQQFIIDALMGAFGDLVKSVPNAIHGKFRKMAASAFAFYRGSAALFYSDMARDDEPFTDEKTGRVWIQGDLHAENFGTYMNSAGMFVFDINDFDESYVGPFTWDVKRLAASLALIGYQKALSDDEIRVMITTVARSYVKQVKQFSRHATTDDFALVVPNTSGKLQELLQQTRLRRRIILHKKNQGR